MATILHLFIAALSAGFAVVTTGVAIADGGDTTLAVALKLLQGDTAIVMQSKAGLAAGIFHGIADIFEYFFGSLKGFVIFLIIMVIVIICVNSHKD